MKIRRILLVLCLMLSVMLCGCSGNSDSEILSTTISQIDMKINGHTEQLHDYDSPYTICYQNKDDTYSMYIFASPIQYKTDTGEYKIIDNTVVGSDKDGFAFENKANEIQTYFPKTLSDSFRVERDVEFMEFRPYWDVEDFSEVKQSIFTNMYGDQVSAVVYERTDMDLAFYPTKAGIKAEIVLKEKPDCNEFVFTVKSSASTYQNKQNGYILFKNGGENESIIYQPLVQNETDAGQQLDVTAQMNIGNDGDDYLVTIAIDESILENAEYPIKIDPSFEMYLNKMPDSTIYSQHDVNNYLASYAVLGEHPVFGEGWHYLRFRLNWFMELDSEKVVRATYSIRNLANSKSNSKIGLMDMNEQWSSAQMLWSTRAKKYSEYLEVEVEKESYIQFDVSDFLKKSFSDESWLEESYGLILKMKDSDAFAVLATSDNCLYSPYIRFDTEELPTVFVPQENINPTT